MITRILSKPVLQSMLKALRAAGLDVVKSASGAYTVTPKGFDAKNYVLKALPGKKNYIVRLESDLFVEN